MKKILNKRDFFSWSHPYPPERRRSSATPPIVGGAASAIVGIHSGRHQCHHSGRSHVRHCGQPQWALSVPPLWLTIVGGVGATTMGNHSERHGTTIVGIHSGSLWPRSPRLGPHASPSTMATAIDPIKNTHKNNNNNKP